MPDWIIELWKQQYPAETVERMMQAFLEERPTCVRCNLDRASMEQILASLEQDRVTVQRNPLAEHALLLSGYDYLDAVKAFPGKAGSQCRMWSSILCGKRRQIRNPETGFWMCAELPAERVCILRISSPEPERSLSAI
ncbi:MAG: hypothetical protein ACLUD2_17825 [Clostridium sp.]